MPLRRGMGLREGGHAKVQEGGGWAMCRAGSWGHRRGGIEKGGPGQARGTKIRGES